MGRNRLSDSPVPRIFGRIGFPLGFTRREHRREERPQSTGQVAELFINHDSYVPSGGRGMSRESLLVEVDPHVFKWLRESAGWSIEDVSKRLKTNPETIQKFEKGEKKPSLHQLRELASAFKRPVAAFLLSKPKTEQPLPTDYRMLPERKDVFDKKTILTIRKARNLQEVSRELLTNVDDQITPRIGRKTIHDNPETLAEEYRTRFGITTELQGKYRNAYELFHHIRDKLEDHNILIFQYSMPVEDARGFALVDKKPNIIVINTKDSIEARLFSLMHEVGHIILGESAIDLPDATAVSRNNIERWCDSFAANFLLPKALAKAVFKERESTLTETATLNYLSRKYKVSKAMLLVSMNTTGFITRNQVEEVLKRHKTAERQRKEGEKTKGSVSADKRCISEKGTKFISLVANNYDRNNITYTDALNYLSIKSKNFDKVLAKARK